MKFRLLILLFLPFFFINPLFSFVNTIISKTPISWMSIPVSYSVKELEKSLNRYYQVEKKGVFYVDDSFTNNSNDNLKVWARQVDEIKVSTEEDKIATKIKVLIEADYLFKKKVKINLWIWKFEHDIKWKHSLSFNIFVTFTTEIKVDKKLKTIPKTTWKYEWLSFPYIGIGPIQLRVLDQIEPMINKVIKDYAFESIDQTLIEEIDLLRIYRQLWSQFKLPVNIAKGINLWTFVELEKTFVGDIKVAEKKVIIPFFFDFYNYLGFSFDSLMPLLDFYDNSAASTVAYKDLNPASKNFGINSYLKLSARDMEKLIFREISERDFEIGENQYKMQVTEVYLNSKNNFITAEIYLKSSVRNNILNYLVIRITFKPFFDFVNDKIEVTSLSYKVVASDSVIVNIVNALQKNNFTKKLEDGIAIAFNSYFKKIKIILNKKLASYQFDEQKIFNVLIKELSVKNAYMLNNNLYLFIHTSGDVKMKLVNLF